MKYMIVAGFITLAPGTVLYRQGEEPTELNVGQRVDPPGLFSTNDAAQAERLVRAACLRAIPATITPAAKVPEQSFKTVEKLPVFIEPAPGSALTGWTRCFEHAPLDDPRPDTSDGSTEEIDWTAYTDAQNAAAGREGASIPPPPNPVLIADADGVLHAPPEASASGGEGQAGATGAGEPGASQGTGVGQAGADADKPPASPTPVAAANGGRGGGNRAKPVGGGRGGGKSGGKPPG
jgi:hypothetical protein